MQPRLCVRQRRLLRKSFELARRPAIRRANSDVVTGHQGFEASNACQCHARFDQPEAGVGFQILLNILVHFDCGDDAFTRAFFIQRQGLYLAYWHALIDHFGFIGDDPFPAFETNLDVDPGFAVSTPAQPAANNQRDEGKNPDGRPVRGRAGFSGR